MATATGTINGITNLHVEGSRKLYKVTASFPAYTGSSDSATITGLGAAIKSHTRNGKTHTLYAAMSMGAGFDTNSQLVYAGACTVSTDLITFNLSDVAGTELTAATASTGVEFAVVIDES